MKPTYRIKDWDANFENAKSRTIDSCSFVCIPNKQHGLGFTRIMAEPDGATIFGIWVLLVEAASRQRRPRAGWLTEDGTRDGEPWATDELALRWRRPLKEVTRALSFLSSSRVGWIEVERIAGEIENEPVQGESPEPIPQDTEVSAQYPSGIPIKNERTEQNEIEGKKEDPQRAIARRATRISSDFVANDAIRKWADEHTPGLDLAYAVEEFVDYWKGVPGQRGTKLDWDATFRNRLRELYGRKRNGYGTSKPAGNQTATERRQSGHNSRLTIVANLQERSRQRTG